MSVCVCYVYVNWTLPENVRCGPSGEHRKTPKCRSQTHNNMRPIFLTLPHHITVKIEIKIKAVRYADEAIIVMSQ